MFKISRSYLDKASPSAPASRGAGLNKNSSGGGARKAKLISAGVSTSVAFGAGYLEGKNMLAIPGAPSWLGIDLLAGAGLHLASYFLGNKMGKYSGYVADAGTGALNNWASYMGLALAKTGTFGGARIAGDTYPTLSQQYAPAPQGQQVFGQQFAPQF